PCSTGIPNPFVGVRDPPVDVPDPRRDPFLGRGEDDGPVAELHTTRQAGRVSLFRTVEQANPLAARYPVQGNRPLEFCLRPLSQRLRSAHPSNSSGHRGPPPSTSSRVVRSSGGASPRFSWIASGGPIVYWA